jgi:cytochrome P450
MTIYHRLMDPEAHRDKQIPSAGSLYEEAQALMFGGTDTVGNTLMVGAFHLLKHPEKMQKLKAELSGAWPLLNENEPNVRDLEKLPYLSAVIKEALRMSSGVTSGLLRIVPKTGATIAGHEVPPQVRTRYSMQGGGRMRGLIAF